MYRGEVLNAGAETVLIRLEGGNQIGVPRASIVRSQVAMPAQAARGLEAFARGDMPQAHSVLRGVMPRYVGLADAWAAQGTLAFGRAATALGKFDEADKVFRAFLHLHPEHPLRLSAHLGGAGIRLARKEYPEALEAFRPLCAPFEEHLKPDAARRALAAEAFLGLGKAAEGLSRWEEALEAYLKVVALFPAEAYYEEALFRSALVRVRLGKNDTAQAALAELIEDFPEGDYTRRAVKLSAAIEQKLQGVAK